MVESTNLSSPFSTGGGGVHFEAHVQAAFVTLMLTDGVAPGLPCWPITKIKPQGRVDGFNTDDLIVFVENPATKEKGKLLAQIKHSIAIIPSNQDFKKMIAAAWRDFTNSEQFAREKDAIALITGPLSATDTKNVNLLLEQARHTNSADEFFTHIEKGKFISSECRKKFEYISNELKSANQENGISKNELHDFLRHFYLLSFDVGNERGVVRSLLHSHISQFQQQYPEVVWSRIKDIVETWDEHAGTITADKMLADAYLSEAFSRRTITTMPKEFNSVQGGTQTDWTQHGDAKFLALAVLVGAWEDKNQADIEVITQLFGIVYDEWLNKARKILHCSSSPLSSPRSGVWKVNDRVNLWNSLGTQIFIQDLDIFRAQVVSVLEERDPAFELSPEERYTASIHGKILTHSHSLRKGIAEGLAILANNRESCSNCSQGNIEDTCSLIVRELLNDADAVTWGSLNDLLPTLAEAAPRMFLDVVEEALRLEPSPFDELFSQESGGITGRNYLTGLLWALEGLAWDKEYLVRACAVLGELASNDPGGQSGNRPSESLPTILLPWLPQTIAPFDKRKIAMETLLKECPEIAWSVLLRLLPNQYQMSSGTHKPIWRKIIPDDWESRVTNQEYWEQSSYYAKLAIEIAGHDAVRLSALIDLFDNLPNLAFEQLLQKLSSEQIFDLSEEQRFAIWNHLTAFIKRHRKFPDAKWSNGKIRAIELVSEKITPTDPLYLHQNLFPADPFEFYDETTNLEEREKKLDALRDEAIKGIFQKNSIETVILFAESVSSPSQAGYALGSIDDPAIDVAVLPNFLDSPNSKHRAFASGFINRRHLIKGLNWCDDINKSDWTPMQIGMLLACLPFSQTTWERASKWLKNNEDEYWNRVDTYRPFTDGEPATAIEKFIEHGRPHAAITRLGVLRDRKSSIDSSLCTKALLAAVSSREHDSAIDRYHILELIKYLQDDPAVNQGELFKIEWAYVFLLDGYSGVTPKILEHRLASDPDFFCEIIRFVFRSKNEEHSSQESTEESRERATNAWRVLNSWKTPPGTQKDGSFNKDKFIEWLKAVKMSCADSGHLEVALRRVGNVLIHSPADPEGLWIHKTIATALNDKYYNDLREGFLFGKLNSRGAHYVDPTGDPEKKLAEQYRSEADAVENAGFHRFADTLQKLANNYTREAEQVVAEHEQENE